MNDPGFWGQNWWQGVGGVFGILAFVVGVIALIVSIRQNRKKSLGYRILYSESLLNVDEQVKNDLVINFQGHVVKQLHILKIQIINNGRISINKNDFGGEPIVLKLTNCSNFISCNEIKLHPENLKLEIQCNPENDEMLIQPLLLNPNDYFDIQITFDGKDRLFSIQGRIEGVNEITNIIIYKHDDLFFSRETFLRIWSIMGVAFVTASILSEYYNFYPYLVTVFFGLISTFTLFVKSLSERITQKAKEMLTGSSS